MPGVNREALLLAAATVNIVYWESGQNPACLERVVEYVRRRVREGPSAPFHTDLLLRIANTAGDEGLAQTIVCQVLDQYDDDVTWLLTVAGIEIEHRKLESARSVLDQVTARDPDNTQAKALRARIIELKSEPEKR